MNDAAYVSAGMAHAAVVKTDGSLWVWGRNTESQLGVAGSDVTDNSGNPYRIIPVKVMDDVVSVCAGSDFTAAIKLDGSLWMWGHSRYASGSMTGNSDTPTKIMDDVASISISDHCNIIVCKTDGSVWTWGANAVGQLGNGTTKDSGTPAKLSGLVAKLPGDGADAISFVDVPDDAYYSVPVQWAIERKVTTGTSFNTFSPDDTCTKGQILTFLWRAVGEPVSLAANPFSDITSEAYYYKAALWAYSSGLISGNRFDANAPCTRGMTVTYLWKLAGSPDTALQTDFYDVPADAEYAHSVAWALENGVTSGTGDTTFSPDATCTRGQIVTFLYRSFAR